MADKVLIDACFMWCKAMNLEPIKADEPALIRMAVADYPGDFAALNEAQRQIIAGLST